jgi:hypothetical protein
MQPTFSSFLNELTMLILWAVASPQAADREALWDVLAGDFSASGSQVGRKTHRMRATKLTLPALFGEP